MTTLDTIAAALSHTACVPVGTKRCVFLVVAELRRAVQHVLEGAGANNLPRGPRLAGGSTWASGGILVT